MSSAKLSAPVSYAISLYLSTVKELGPRDAYAAAVEIAGLRTAAERAALRNAVYSIK